MKSEVVQRIVLSEDEKACIEKATNIVSKINEYLLESFLLDMQELPDCIEKLTGEVILMENRRPYSAFNVLTDDARDRLVREAVNK